MQTEELRIGNIIVDTSSGRIGSVIYLSKNKIVVKLEHSTLYQGIEEYEPIPLTEEILLKCGFEKVEVEIEDYYACTYERQLNSDVFISYADDFSCTLYWNKKSSIKEYGVIPNWDSVRTLHGLQNIHHSLTGQELEISLKQIIIIIKNNYKISV